MHLSPFLIRGRNGYKSFLLNFIDLKPAVVRGDYWAPTNCSLTVNGGVASLIAWLDHSCQKTEVGGKQGHAPCRKISLQQIPIHGVNPAISAKGTTPDGN